MVWCEFSDPRRGYIGILKFLYNYGIYMYFFVRLLLEL